MTLHFYIVEDDTDYAELLAYQLRRQSDPKVSFFTLGEEAIAALGNLPDLVFLDLGLPGQSGLETLRRIKEIQPDLPVVIVSAQTDVNVALEAMRLGAYDYVTKGHDDTVKVRSIAGHITERVRLSQEVQSLRALLPAREGLEHLIGESAAMARVFSLVHKALRGDLTVAILGESGTGKELIAHAIHANSKRKKGPFVVVNCAAIPHELMESEFFGHEKGSFTGAHARKIGKFEQADGGTLFLDEIGELHLSLQAKLLRAIQNREITRVGGQGTIHFDTRVICATNQDVIRMVEENTFREDLYYRLFQFPIPLPRLMERENDILLLSEHFRKSILAKNPEMEARPFSGAARRQLLQYPWPGNVRELRTVVERALMLSETEEILPADLMLHDVMMQTGIRATPSFSATETPADEAASREYERPTSPEEIIPLEAVNQQAVTQAYQLCDGNIAQAAKYLQVSRTTVYRILKKIDALG